MSRRVSSHPYVTPVGTNRLQLVLRAGQEAKSLSEVAREQQLRLRVLRNLKDPPPKGPLHPSCAPCRKESKESKESTESKEGKDTRAVNESS